MKTQLSVCLVLLAGSLTLSGAEPKRLLVVTANNGFRHSSIETTEKVIRELAARSGDFVVVSTMDHPDYPDYSVSAGGNRDADAQWGNPFGPQVNDGTPAQQTFIRRLNDRVNSPLAPMHLAIQEAEKAVIAAAATSGPGSRELAAAVDALARAEEVKALAQAGYFAELQASDNRLSPAQVQVLMGRVESASAPATTFAPQVGAATPLQQKAIAAANASARFVALTEAVTTAEAELASASLELPRDAARVRARLDALASAELDLALARADEFARIQATVGPFNSAVTQTLVSRFSLPETGSVQNDGAAKVFADMLSPEALKNYDGVFFASTVGTLPFPDREGFMDWVREGGAWMGNHAASDSMHGDAEFFDMMGGEFTGHGSQTTEIMTVMDTTNPVGAAIGAPTFTVRDEMYTFENENYDQSKVHSILSFTAALNDGMHSPVGAPGHWPSTWIKEYGKGRVFYTALGHREDVIDPVITVTGEERLNPPEVAETYQRMLLAGIRWSLGLIGGDATPQVRVPTPAGGPDVVRGGRGGGGPQ